MRAMGLGDLGKDVHKYLEAYGQYTPSTDGRISVSPF
jgi:hypothetical protein